MTDLISQLQAFLQNNQLLGTVAGGSIIVWLVSNLKMIFNALKDWTLNFISFTINNIYEDDRFTGTPSLSQSIFDQIISEAYVLWERNVNLDYKNNSNYSNFNITTYGKSIKILNKKLCVIRRSYETNNTKNNIHTTIQVFFARKNKFMKSLNDTIKKRTEEWCAQFNNNDNIIIFSDNSRFIKNKRSLSSIFTTHNEHYKAFQNINKFIQNIDIYKKLNYPYKYCCCLHGKPGCGKSSTVLAIASELNRNIRYINLSTINVSELIKQLSYYDEHGRKTIFVFEDIDALNWDTVNSRNSTNENKIANNQICNVNLDAGIKIKTLSLSDLLNVTDGLLSCDGSICIFTTNHIERLDAALLRAGRMNDIIEFSYLDAITANKMIKYHLGYEVENLKAEIKPAELQDMILNIMTKHATKDDLIKNFCETK